MAAGHEAGFDAELAALGVRHDGVVRMAGRDGSSQPCQPATSQPRLCTAILRHLVLIMAALAICAVTAATRPGHAGTTSAHA